MSHSTNAASNHGCLANELTCYLQSDITDINLSNMSAIELKYGARYSARQYLLGLPLGKLSLFKIVLHLPSTLCLADIEAVRLTTLKAAMLWQKTSPSQHEEDNAAYYAVLVVDIHLTEEAKANVNLTKNGQKNKSSQRFKHSFGARYFMEHLIVDVKDQGRRLQVFSGHDWRLIWAAVQTPSELWRFLEHHLEQLNDSINSQIPSFETEEALVTQFLYSTSIFTPAIVIDNALITYDIQDEPNPALVAMTLAYKSKSTTAQMYHQHLQQAAALWSQLSMQMIETVKEKIDNNDKVSVKREYAYWQQQLLDESLFSRHELIRTLYKYPKQGQKLQQTGYVVHQHSYERLGRHYVLIFYGQDVEGQNGKKTIQSNLAKIAQDVGTRLPIAELHHVIVLGIDFISEAQDTFVDIDLWIQPVYAMTQRERQLTKQLEHLKQQSSM